MDCLQSNLDPFQLMELKHAKRILLELMGDSLYNINAPFIYAVDSTEPGVEDYYERIKEPMWMTKMENKFDCSIYQSISEFVCDFRLMLFNCYIYNAAETRIFKMASRLERIFEQKLTLLPRDIREKTTLNTTLSTTEQKEEAAATLAYSRRARGTESGSNAFLRAAISSGHDIPPMQALAMESMSVNGSTSIEGGCSVKEAVISALRSWECHREELRLLNTWDEWASEKLTPFNKNVLRTCIALPQLTQLLSLAAEALCIPTSCPVGFSTFALEWALLTPRSSTLLARIVSSLLARHLERPRLHKTSSPISYSVWEERLSNRVANWYRLLPAGMEHFSSEMLDLTCSRLGFEASLVRTLGWKNPLHPIGEKHFHDLTLLQRIYLLKALADWCITCQESLRQQLDSSAAWDNVTERVLGSARMLPTQDIWIFVHFPGFDDSGRFRVYRRPRHPRIHYHVEAPVLHIPSKKRSRKTESNQPQYNSKNRPRNSLVQSVVQKDQKDDCDMGRLSAKRPKLDEVKESAVERRRNMSCRYKLRGVVHVDPYENEQSAIIDNILLSTNDINNACDVKKEIDLECDFQSEEKEVPLNEDDKNIVVLSTNCGETENVVFSSEKEADVVSDIDANDKLIPNSLVLSDSKEAFITLNTNCDKPENVVCSNLKEAATSGVARIEAVADLNLPEQNEATACEFELVAENLSELRALINALTEVRLLEEREASAIPGDSAKRKVKKKLLLDLEEENEDTDTNGLLSSLEILAAEWESVLVTRLLPNERRIKLHLRREDEALRLHDERASDADKKLIFTEEENEKNNLSTEQANARRKRHELRRRNLSGCDDEVETNGAFCNNGDLEQESSADSLEENEHDERKSSALQNERTKGATTKVNEDPSNVVGCSTNYRRSARAIAASQRQRETFRRFYASESSNEDSCSSDNRSDDEHDDDYGFSTASSDIRVQARPSNSLVYGRGRPRGRPRGSLSNVNANRLANHSLEATHVVSNRFWRAPSFSSSNLIRTSTNNVRTVSSSASRFVTALQNVRNTSGGVNSALPSPSEGLPINRANQNQLTQNLKYAQLPPLAARSVVCVSQPPPTPPPPHSSLVTVPLSFSTNSTFQNKVRVVHVDHMMNLHQQQPTSIQQIQQLPRTLQQLNGKYLEQTLTDLTCQSRGGGDMLPGTTTSHGTVVSQNASFTELQSLANVSQGSINMNTLTQTVAALRGSITCPGTADVSLQVVPKPLVQLLTSQQPSAVSSAEHSPASTVKTSVSLADLLQLLRSNVATSTVNVANPTVGPVLQSPPRLPPLSKHNVVPLSSHCLQTAKSATAADGGSDVQLPLDIEAAVLRLLHSSSSTSPIQAPPSPSLRLVSVASPQQQPLAQQGQQIFLLPPGTSLVSAGPQQLLLLQTAAATSDGNHPAAPIMPNVCFQQQKPTAYVQPQVQLRPQISVHNSAVSRSQVHHNAPQQQQQSRAIKLYNVGGTLFTSDGQPVCIDNKNLRYLSKDSIEPGLLTLASNMIKEAQRKASLALNNVTTD